MAAIPEGASSLPAIPYGFDSGALRAPAPTLGSSEPEQLTEAQIADIVELLKTYGPDPNDPGADSPRATLWTGTLATVEGAALGVGGAKLFVLVIGGLPVAAGVLVGGAVIVIGGYALVNGGGHAFLKAAQRWVNGEATEADLTMLSSAGFGALAGGKFSEALKAIHSRPAAIAKLSEGEGNIVHMIFDRLANQWRMLRDFDNVLVAPAGATWLSTFLAELPPKPMWPMLAGPTVAPSLAVNWGCFAAGTLVDSEQGVRAIESISVGERVWGFSEARAQVELHSVTRVFKYDDKRMLRLQIGDERVLVTHEHPFFVKERGWVSAAKLRTGDEIQSAQPNCFSRVLEVYDMNERATVYNLEVENVHTYYVTKSRLLVHNTSEGPRDRLSTAPTPGVPQTGTSDLPAVTQRVPARAPFRLPVVHLDDPFFGIVRNFWYGVPTLTPQQQLRADAKTWLNEQIASCVRTLDPAAIYRDALSELADVLKVPRIELESVVPSERQLLGDNAVAMRVYNKVTLETAEYNRRLGIHETAPILKADVDGTLFVQLDNHGLRRQTGIWLQPPGGKIPKRGAIPYLLAFRKVGPDGPRISLLDLLSATPYEFTNIAISIRERLAEFGITVDNYALKSLRLYLSRLRGGWRNIRNGNERKQLCYKLNQLLIDHAASGGRRIKMLKGDGTETDGLSYILYKRVVSEEMTIPELYKFLGRANDIDSVRPVTTYLAHAAPKIPNPVEMITLLYDDPDFPVTPELVQAYGSEAMIVEDYFQDAIATAIEGTMDVDDIVSVAQDIARGQDIGPEYFQQSFDRLVLRGFIPEEPAGKIYYALAERGIVPPRTRAQLAEAWLPPRRGLFEGRHTVPYQPADLEALLAEKLRIDDINESAAKAKYEASWQGRAAAAYQNVRTAVSNKLRDWSDYLPR